MKPAPTDYEILNEIYELHYDTFSSYMEGAEKGTDRSSKIYVPVDILSIAKKLKVDPDIIFGRLYYDLQKRYGYKHEDGTGVPFFTPKAGDDKHCIHFPYLSSVIADLRSERKKHHTAIILSIIALFIALGSLLISMTSGST